MHYSTTSLPLSTLTALLFAPIRSIIPLLFFPALAINFLQNMYLVFSIQHHSHSYNCFAPQQWNFSKSESEVLFSKFRNSESCTVILSVPHILSLFSLALKGRIHSTFDLSSNTYYFLLRPCHTLQFTFSSSLYRA